MDLGWGTFLHGPGLLSRAQRRPALQAVPWCLRTFLGTPQAWCLFSTSHSASGVRAPPSGFSVGWRREVAVSDWPAQWRWEGGAGHLTGGPSGPAEAMGRSSRQLCGPPSQSNLVQSLHYGRASPGGQPGWGRTLAVVPGTALGPEGRIWDRLQRNSHGSAGGVGGPGRGAGQLVRG